VYFYYKNKYQNKSKNNEDLLNKFIKKKNMIKKLLVGASKRL